MFTIDMQVKFKDGRYNDTVFTVAGVNDRHYAGNDRFEKIVHITRKDQHGIIWRAVVRQDEVEPCD